MYNTAEMVGIAVGQIKGKCPEDPWCPKDRLNTVVGNFCLYSLMLYL